MTVNSSPNYEVLLAYKDSAYLLAFRILRDRSLAEDVVQDAYIKAIKHFKICDTEDGQRNWFLKIVANTAKNVRTSDRSRKKREKVIAMRASKSERIRSQEDARFDSQLKEAVKNALEAIDEKYRIAISMHYEQGVSYADASQILDMPATTLRSNAKRGIEKIRRLLRAKGYPVQTRGVLGVIGAGFGIAASARLTASVTQLMHTALLDGFSTVGNIKTALRSAKHVRHAGHAIGGSGVKFAAIAVLTTAVIAIAFDAVRSNSTPQPFAPPIQTPAETPETPPTPAVEEPAPETPVRVTDGLSALYTFKDANGDRIRDVSGVEPALDLIIHDTSRVQWLPGGGLYVRNPVLIQSAQSAAKFYQSVTASDTLSLEAWIKPNDPTEYGPARIVTISDGGFDRNVTLAQNRIANSPRCYVLRLRTTETGANGTKDGNIELLDSTFGSVKKELTHVVVTFGADGTARFYLNGKLDASTHIEGDCSNWRPDFLLTLAAESPLSRPWTGEIHLVALYGRELSADDVQRNYRAGP